MNKIFITAGKFSLSLIGLIFLVASATAQTPSPTPTSQTNLRKGLDFDGDGKADYVIFRPSDNTVYVSKSGGGSQSQSFSTSFSTLPAPTPSPALPSTPSTRDYFTPGDYDGDGIADYSIWRDSNGYWYQLRSTSSTFVALAYGAPGDEPVARDYDGDGITDLAVVKRGPSTTAIPAGQMNWNYFRSSNSTYATFDFCYSVDVPVPGDYDGDGKFDIACYRPGETPRNDSRFFIMPSNIPPPNSPPYWYDVVFGKGGDQAVPGDYDGDGKTDLAVVRDGVTSSHGLSWLIKRSSDGVEQLPIPFGLTGTDRPAQADYDGDGITDIAIWRERLLGRGFWIRRSSDSVTYSVAWGTGGDIPVANYDTH